MRLLTAFLIFTGTFSFARTIDDFTNPGSFEIEGTASGEQIHLEPPPGSRTPKICLTFDRDRQLLSRRLNLKWNTARKQPFLREDFQVRLTVLHTAPAPYSLIALRIRDSQNEMFQFNPFRRIKEKDNRETLIYRIKNNSAQAHWGRNANGKLDFPIFMKGVAVAHHPEVSQGKLFFETLETENLRKKDCTAVIPLLNLKSGNSALINLSEADSGIEASASRLSWTGNAKTAAIRPYFKEKTYPAPERLRIRLNVKKGNGRISLRFHDSTHRKYDFSKEWNGNGIQTLEIPVSLKDTEITFQKLSLLFKEKQGFELDILGIDAVIRTVPEKTLGCDVLTGNDVHVLKTGEEHKLKLAFNNLSGKLRQWKIKAMFRNFSGNGFDKEIQLETGPGERKTVPVTEKLDSKGIWYVRFIVSLKNGKENAEHYKSFAYMDEPEATSRRPRNEFMFGICMQLLGLPEKEYKLGKEALLLTGAKLLRGACHWDTIQPQENIWNFQPTDKLIRDMEQCGIALNMTLHPVPRWAVPPERRNLGYGVWSRSKPMPGLYRKFVEKVVSRYRGKVYFWEIWNEPDLIRKTTLNELDYLEVLKEGAQGIRKADPGAWVTTGGFGAIAHPRTQKNFQENILKKGKAFYDIHAFHQHGSFAEYASIIENEFLPMRKRTGTAAPWFANETALTSVGNTENAQALAVFKKIMFAWARGSISYNWYNLRNSGMEPFNGEHNYGLFTYDFYPKASFSAFAEMSRLYTGMKFDREIKIGNGQYLFRFSGANRIILGGWNESANIPPLPLLLKTDAESAVLADLMGNRAPLRIHEGKVIYPLQQTPSSLILTKATRVTPDVPLIQTDLSDIIIPGKIQNFTVSVSNPFQQETKLRLAFTLPEKMKMRQTAVERRLRAGERIRIPLTLNTTKDFNSKNSELHMSYELPPFKGNISLSLHSAVLIPKTPMEKRRADFEINRPENVYNRYQADPLTEYRTWKGPADLSAGIHLEKGKNGLRIKLVVEDDKHVQPYTGANVYNGDNVQLALQLPDQTGMWEIGLTHLASGKPEVFVWVAPTGFQAKKTAEAIKLKTVRKGTETVYDAVIPYSAIGLTDRIMNSGFRFNVLINENDGEGRDGWLFLAPGLGTDKNPARFPNIVFE